MRSKIIYILSVILALFIGISGTLVVLSKYPINGEIIEKEVKNVNVTESDTIKSAIDEVYDAVLYIESYNNDRLSSTGTGFIYKKDKDSGYIITNHHVIANANKIQVVNTSGIKVEAKLLGSDEFADIAVLSIKAESVLKTVKIGDSTELNLGDTLFTVGSPLGELYMGTVTKGILSGKDRTVEVDLANKGSFMMEVIQTDAAINPGNSGGPLCNINGEVIGVNSLKLVQDEIEGMGFAIPIEIVMAGVDRLEKGEEIKRPYLGVSIIDVTDFGQLYYYRINLDESITQGAVVVSAEESSPAHKAKLKLGDVIVEIDGVKIKSVAHLRFILYKYEVGDTITVKYNRNGKIETTKILLDLSLEEK
ncbi:MAG: trypsin-like peptidase domain-containing protein [Bacilli bacterium]|nr:trypsin-like peptidase domain-containing protein [Bacilli bacterium]MDD4809050.1 trypsin-like peptidase domain-containing protein [Bacilli bacterium]